MQISKENPVVLVGDIGGTNARLSAWRAGAKNEEIYSKVSLTRSRFLEKSRKSPRKSHSLRLSLSQVGL